MSEPDSMPPLDRREGSAPRRRVRRLLLATLLIAPAAASILYTQHRRSAPRKSAEGQPSLATRAFPIGPGAMSGSDQSTPAGTVAEAMPEASFSRTIELRSGAAIPSIVLHVRQPPKLRAALADNDWLQRLTREPLGKGFLGSWAGFLLTRGEDLRAQFSGTIAQYFADKLLQTPFFAIWYEGPGAGAPAIVLL